jgi:hypothetical protein
MQSGVIIHVAVVLHKGFVSELHVVNGARPLRILTLDHVAGAISHSTLGLE